MQTSRPRRGRRVNIAKRGSRRGLRLTLVAVVVSAASLGVLAAPAAAISFTTHLTPGNTAFLQLDVSGASVQQGAQVIDWYANGGANQVWTFNSLGGNTYTIVNQNSGMCLTTDDVAADQVYQWPCTGAGGTNQEWVTSLNPFGAPGYYTIQSVSSGLYLDVNSDNPFAGTPIDTWYYNGNPNQKFAAD